jgi:rhodanese-related sulfurtransferase
VAIYCTRPPEATSARAARRLNKLGFKAAALEGGFAAWKARYPVELAEVEHAEAR